jgi:hypothetical protein
MTLNYHYIVTDQPFLKYDCPVAAEILPEVQATFEESDLEELKNLPEYPKYPVLFLNDSGTAEEIIDRAIRNLASLLSNAENPESENAKVRYTELIGKFLPTL